MASVSDFRVNFPEFSSGGGPSQGVSDARIANYLDAAKLELDTMVWGAYGTPGGPLNKIDWGQMYLAAHKLAISPWGQNAKLVLRPTGPRDRDPHPWSRTTYGVEFYILMRSVASGFRVC